MLYEGKILKVNSDQNKQNIIFLIIKSMRQIIILIQKIGKGSI